MGLSESKPPSLEELIQNPVVNNLVERIRNNENLKHVKDEILFEMFDLNENGNQLTLHALLTENSFDLKFGYKKSYFPLYLSKKKSTNEKAVFRCCCDPFDGNNVDITIYANNIFESHIDKLSLNPNAKWFSCLIEPEKKKPIKCLF